MPHGTFLQRAHMARTHVLTAGPHCTLRMLRGVRAKAHCYSSDVGSYTSKAHYYITHYYIYPLLIVIYSSRHLGRVLLALACHRLHHPGGPRLATPPPARWQPRPSPSALMGAPPSASCAEAQSRQGLALMGDRQRCVVGALHGQRMSSNAHVRPPQLPCEPCPIDSSSRHSKTPQV